MAGILEYSTTAGSNTAINSIGIQGSDSVQNMDNALRQLLADIASQITRRVTKSANYTALKTDHKKLIEFTASATLSLTAAATLTDGWMCIVKANGGDVTIDPSSSETIDGSATKSVADGSFAFVYCNGSAFHTIAAAPLPSKLSDIGDLTATDGNIIVGNGSTWVAESGATARTSLGAQTQGDVLDDLNTLGAATTDGQFIVATGAGAFAYESGDTALTSLGGGTTGINIFKDTTAAAVRTEIGLGTAATKNTGTSGNTIPLLDGANTFSAAQIISAALTVNGAIARDTATIQLRPNGAASSTGQMTIETSGNVTINGTLTITG